MKRYFVIVILLFSSILIHAQKVTDPQAAAFEAAIRSGNSATAFEFVRNMFGVPAIKDPFLHFKERGIKQLVSFYVHRDKRIEATSLIRFDQVKEFWKNYSRQFTAGKWNYKTLYKNDSLAWLAANYSITLIYAHEMGHYMSYNHVHDFSDDYTCEEVVANECLAAFANAFKSNKNLEMHRRLFISLAKQTYEFVPDSNKTGFSIPMHKWCASDPMNPFFDYFTSDETRFLRLYGYTQFRMMESALVNYNGVTWPNFLTTTFFDFYDTYTGAETFKPLRYKVMSTKLYKNALDMMDKIELGKGEKENYFHYYALQKLKYYFDPNGQVLESAILDESFNYGDSIPGNEFARFDLVNRKKMETSSVLLHDLVLEDSISHYHSPGKTINTSFEILSAFQNDSNFYYLVKDYSGIYSEIIEMDSFYVHHQLVNLVKRNGKHYFRYFLLPDSLSDRERTEETEMFVAGINTGKPLFITNELNYAHEQTISIYPVNMDSLRLDPVIWQGKMEKKGFFNMLYPTLYLDEASSSLIICFWNPVTSGICLIKISDKGTLGFQLYENSFRGSYGPKMDVMALRLVGPNKLYVFAKTKEPGNNTKPRIQRKLVQW